VLTIGVGHTSDEHLKVTEGLVITKEKAMELLALDMKEAEDVVERLVTVPLTQGQYDALADFVFNVGEGQFSRSTLLKLVNASLYEQAAEQFKRWVYDNGKVQPGLVKRNVGRKQMFLEA
jgi:lysozyme